MVMQAGGMPELPEVESLAVSLTGKLADLRLASLDVVAISALKTVRPGPDDLLGTKVRGVQRKGKFLAMRFDGPLFLVVHLARAGWIRVSPKVPASTRPKPGGPLAVRAVFVDDDGEPAASLTVTEAGTRKGVALYVVPSLDDVPGVGALGPDALTLTAAQLRDALDAAGGTTLKTLLRDQKTIAGIGNAYSDEILFAARLSPYQPAASVSADQFEDLHAAIRSVLAEAVDRAAGVDPTSLKAEKRDGLRVHGRTGQPCRACGTPIAEVALADSAFQYCPTCQTGGKRLSDRRMSRLLK